LSIPLSAVIDSGTRQVVLVQVAEGRFQPRVVQLGARNEEQVVVLQGLAEDETVVTRANFLIDAESNLKAALSGFGASQPVAAMPEERQEVVPPIATHEQHASKIPVKKSKPAVVAHQARGVLNAINADGMVSITHEAIASLGWPGMTMDFALANASLAADIPPGSAITFEIVERKPDDWVITKLRAQHGGH
jgi:Cu(I)/Ag(I) efflux system membrane fusion protein